MATKNPFVNEFGDVSNELLLNIAEILTLRLPEGTERIIAAKWMKKFLKCSPKDYKHNLSLFVCSLTKQMLVEPFDRPPMNSGSAQWENFEREFTRKDINEATIRRIYKDALAPAYKMDISQDLQEFSCFQEIPFFGAHFYYAFSPQDRIDKWSNFNKLNVPKNFVELLLRDEPVESPIKGRGNSKSQTLRGGVRTNARASTRPRPQWEGPIQEEEEAPPTLRPMISIPLNPPGKPIPTKLKMRMAAAAERSNTLKEKRIQESSRASSRRKKPSQRPQLDNIDSQLMSEAAPSQPVVAASTSPPMPEFTGPTADLQRRLYTLRKSNPPQDLIQTTREMSEASAALSDEAQKMRLYGTASIDSVSQIERREVNIGSNILKIMRINQVEEVQNVADNAIETVEQVQVTMETLNQMLGRHAKPTDDTIRRLEEIKLSMQVSAQAAANISLTEGGSTKDDGNAAAGELVDKLDGISQVYVSMAERLVDIGPTTRADANVLMELTEKCFENAKTARKTAKNLELALEKKLPGAKLAYDAAMSIDQILELSLSGDEYTNRIEDLTPDVRKVVEIERKVHEERLKQTVAKQFSKATSTPNVARYLKYDSDDDDEDNLIDVNAQNLDFGEVANEEELHKTLGSFSHKPCRRKTQLVEVDDAEESLFNISDGLVSDINKSIEEIEQNILPELESNQSGAETAEERAIYVEAIEALQSHVTTLDQCLDVVGEINQSLAGGDVE